MVTKEMSIGEVLRIDRNTAPVFMSFGMHCLGCPHATAESLEQAAVTHGVDVEKLVASLNDCLASA
jgi:hybrid cluster-associated redox disulfide protein